MRSLGMNMRHKQRKLKEGRRKKLLEAVAELHHRQTTCTRGGCWNCGHSLVQRRRLGSARCFVRYIYPKRPSVWEDILAACIPEESERRKCCWDYARRNPEMITTDLRSKEHRIWMEHLCSAQHVAVIFGVDPGLLQQAYSDYLTIIALGGGE